MIDDRDTLVSEIETIARSEGATEFQFIDPKKVITAQWVRQKCQFGCPNYGTRLSCPPFTPEPGETRKILSEYTRAYILGYDGFSYRESHPGLHEETWWSEFGSQVRKSMLKLERHAFLAGYYKAMAYGFGGCRRCETCALAEGRKTCNHPAEFRTSMEAAGIDVYGTVLAAGLKMGVLPEKGITKKGQLVLHVLLLLE